MKKLTDEVWFYPQTAIRHWRKLNGEIVDIEIRPNWHRVIFIDEGGDWFAMMIYRPAKDTTVGLFGDSSEIYVVCLFDDEAKKEQHAKEIEDEFCKRYDAGELD